MADETRQSERHWADFQRRDSHTGEAAGDGCRGRNLRVLGHGGSALPVTLDFQRRTVRDGRATLQQERPGVVAPMASIGRPTR